MGGHLRSLGRFRVHSKRNKKVQRRNFAEYCLGSEFDYLVWTFERLELILLHFFRIPARGKLITRQAYTFLLCDQNDTGLSECAHLLLTGSLAIAGSC